MNKEEIEELQKLLSLDDQEETKSGGFDMMALIKVLWAKRKYYFISLPVAAIAGLLLVLCVPKYYAVQVVLAPELSSSTTSVAGLGGLMKNLGVGRLPSGGDADAILPNLYPDLMNSQAFLVSLFDIPVESLDGSIKTTYYDYLNRYQQVPWWTQCINSVISAIAMPDEDEIKTMKANYSRIKKKGAKKVNPFALTKRQNIIAQKVASNIICDVDNKTYVISIAVKAQDPYICATLADSTCQRLQNFITEYRTKKAQVEYDHMLEQYENAKEEYEEAKAKVAAYNDANWDLVEEEFVVEKQALQNEMSLRFSALSTINTQLLAARSKLDEARPVFTILDGAAVPIKHTGPKKKTYMLAMMFLVGMIQTLWILRKEFKQRKLAAQPNND